MGPGGGKPAPLTVTGTPVPSAMMGGICSVNPQHTLISLENTLQTVLDKIGQPVPCRVHVEIIQALTSESACPALQPQLTSDPWGTCSWVIDCLDIALCKV
jgi:hypothetical protein